MSKPQKRREITLNDRLDAEAVDAAVEAIIVILKQAMSKDPTRRIRQLTKPELRNLFYAALSAYVLRRSYQHVADDLDRIIEHAAAQLTLN